MADGVRAEIYGGQIERDVLAGKKAVRAPRTGVEIGEPVHDRRLGCDGEGPRVVGRREWPEASLSAMHHDFIFCKLVACQLAFQTPNDGGC